MPEGDKKNENNLIQGQLFIYQYNKDIQLKDSRFNKPVEYGVVKGVDGKFTTKKRDIAWKKPVLAESFSLNDISWEVFEDAYYNDLVFKGQTEKYNIEITTQGNFPIDRMKDLLRFCQLPPLR